MRKPNTLLLPLFLMLTILVTNLSAQSFDEALELYQQDQFEDALEMFLSIEEDDRATLFAGKSHLALGNYVQAEQVLKEASESDQSRIADEAIYTLALLAFQLKDYSRSLERLYSLRSQLAGGINRQTRSLYNSILSYLTPRERLNTFWRVDSTELRLDLLESAARGVDPEMARAMLLMVQENSDFTTEQENRIQRIEGLVEQSLGRELTPLRYRPPMGTVYHIGVALPSFEENDPNLAVSRGLYSGLLFAAEEFNARHSDRKVFLRYRDTFADPDSASRAMHELIWAERADALIGPLFSEEATLLSRLAEQYQVPLLTPLANSDEINEGHHYTFQLNPTFNVHGREMARFAVQELHLDTLAILSQQTVMGESYANAFRGEAERLGAHIAYDIRENFADYGYDLSEITEVFTQDQALIDSLGYRQVDGLYAPFAGQDAETLVSQLMTDLELMGANLVIFGSEEWGLANLTDAQHRNFEIYHTKSYQSESPGVDETFFDEFQTRFGFAADEFARIGYDSGRYLMEALDRAGNPAILPQALRNAPPFSGLAFDIHFDGTQINRSLHIEALTSPARDRLDD